MQRKILLFCLTSTALQESTDIGVVTAIAAPAALEVHFYGDGGHAGAQLMPLR
jgi:ureidoglycolate amidohydrolase